MIKSVLLILLIIICILYIFHLQKYNKKSSVFDVIQINDRLKDYTQYLNDNVPIILQNHKLSFIKKILSPLTLQKIEKKEILTNYKYHKNDLYFISPDEDITINLLLPIEKKKFQYQNNKLTIVNDNYNYTEIKLAKNMIIGIPRFWIFKVNQDISVNTLTTNTIFTYLFSKIY